MLVYLLRHGRAADSDPRQPRSDEARPLTADGEQRLRRAMRVYRMLMTVPEVVFTSPLVRARRTAEILLEELDSNGDAAPRLQETGMLTPAAAPSQAVQLLQGELLDDRMAVALVGHEPHLGALLGLLLTGSDHHAVPLKKGMLVAVEVDQPQTMLARLQFVLPQRIGSEL